MSRVTLGMLAALTAMGSLSGAEVDPRSLQMPAPRLDYGGPKPTGRVLRGRIDRNRNWLDAARANTAKHKGNPPGYTYAHRDVLVRLYGARAANVLERRILKRVVTFEAVIARAAELMR
jgi:hypothetical protein